MFGLSRNASLEEQVRRTIRTTFAHPDAIKARAAGGIVTLRGEIASEDEHRLLSAVFSVEGVREILNRLESHPRADLHEASPEPTSFPATA